MSENKPLHVTNVCKSFKNKRVLQDISFEVNGGEIFGLIGMNGVGKTTLIKIMLNLLEADKGGVTFFDHPSVQAESRKHIAYLPEKFYPSQFLKGKEFLSLAISYFGKILDEAVAHEKAQALNLELEALDRKVGKYSKGMGQKLGLLSVFLSEAPLLILDEPMSGLDPGARILLKDMLIDYKQQGKSVFFSSHILSDIEEICDKVAVLHDTKLIYIGEPKHFREKYQESTLERSFLRAVREAA